MNLCNLNIYKLVPTKKPRNRNIADLWARSFWVFIFCLYTESYTLPFFCCSHIPYEQNPTTGSEVGQNFTIIVKFWKNSYFQITGPYPKVVGYKDSSNYVVSKYIINIWVLNSFVSKFKFLRTRIHRRGYFLSKNN